MHDEGQPGVLCDFEIGFPFQRHVPVIYIKVPGKVQFTIGIQPNPGAIRQGQFCPGPGLSQHFFPAGNSGGQGRRSAGIPFAQNTEL